METFRVCNPYDESFDAADNVAAALRTAHFNLYYRSELAVEANQWEVLVVLCLSDAAALSARVSKVLTKMKSADRKRGQRKGATSKNVTNRQNVVKYFSTLFDLSRRAKKNVKKCQKSFRHFSTVFARHQFSGPFWGDKDEEEDESESLDVRESFRRATWKGGGGSMRKVRKNPVCGSENPNFLRHVMRAIWSVRPKCSHRCVSLKETPFKPVQSLKHITENSVEQTVMRTKWLKHIAI